VPASKNWVRLGQAYAVNARVWAEIAGIVADVHAVTTLRRIWQGARRRRAQAAGVAAFVVALLPARATEDFTTLSLEELSAVKISLATRHTQRLFGTPAAVSVLLGDEIERYGANSVVDGLRLVPGVWVANTNTDRWAVGIRGFNGLTSTKLLVLVDGRNIYSPYYGGVDWSEANVELADLDRVEVVRGPGGTLWGANAVNGIINVVSKSARDTQGTLVRVRDGTDEGIDGYARYGGMIDSRTWYRVFWRVSDSDDRLNTARSGPREEFEQSRAGMRFDREQTTNLQFTWQAEVGRLRHNTFATDPVTGGLSAATSEHNFANTIGRMTWKGAAGDRLTAQVFADYADDRSQTGSYRGFSGGSFGAAEDGHNFDLDLAHEIKRGSHELIWGAAARETLIDLDLDQTIAVRQPRVTQRMYSFFAQDEIDVVDPDRVRLTWGSKFEHRDWTGWQMLPSVRLTVSPNPNSTGWLAVSRTVRSPSQVERDSRITFAATPATAFAPPTLTQIVANSSFHEERMVAYEAGWRWKPSAQLAFDASLYVNEYADLRDLDPVTTIAPTGVLTELRLVNRTRATGEGAELMAEWRPSDRWRATATYTIERLRPHGSVFPFATGFDFAEPRQMASVRGWWEIASDFELSAATYYTAAVASFALPAAVRIDAQATWRPRPNLELNLGIQNAGDPQHPEYSPISVTPTAEARRNAFVRMQWRF
jgi:iron complex outermembrane recepter protein